MSRKLHIGVDFSLPIDSVTQTFAILAKRGVGKSYTASVISEEMLEAGQQIVAVDPTGAWWGLRSGYPIAIIGGEHADIPLEQSAGEVVARAVIENRFSAVIDLSLFRKAQMFRFMVDFTETLYRLNRQPLHLFVDEADSFAPQTRNYGGDENRLLGAMEDLVRRGRKRGIGCTLITQRPAVLNKNVLTQCEVLLAMRMVHPRDIKAIEEWVNVHGDPQQAVRMIDDLPELPVGTAWLWSPGWLGEFRKVKVRERRTFDSGATPKPGQKITKPKSLAEIDINQLGEQIKSTVEKAKENDPRELRKKIATLEAQVSRPVSTPAPERVEVPVLKNGQLDRALNVITKAETLADSLFERYHKLHETLGTEIRQLNEAVQRAIRPTASVATAPRVPAAPTPALRSSKSKPDSGGIISRVEQKILNATMELHELGVECPPRVHVAFMCGYSNMASKGFANALSVLRVGGYIDYPTSKDLRLTDLGRRHADDRGTPQSVPELHQRIFALLGGKCSEILKPIIEAYPEPLPRAVVAEGAGYTNMASKGFANSLSALRTYGFIDYPDTKSVVAAPLLFLQK